MPEPGQSYATKFAVPRHLYALAMQNADLISRVTRDGFDFLYSRCKRDIGLASIVAVGLATLIQEYETGEHTKAVDMDFQAVAEQNGETLHGREDRRAKVVVEGIAEFGEERVQRIAAALYAANREITLLKDVGETVDDASVHQETRNQYRWAAVISLRANAV